MASKRTEVARFLNSLLDFSSEDQQSLVEVIQDYFIFPEGSADSDVEEDLSEDDEVEPNIILSIIQHLEHLKTRKNLE